MSTANQTRSGAEVPARPQGCTNLKLRQLGRRVTSHYDAELAKTGLKVTQYSLLSHVVKLGPLRPVDLAAAMRMSASTLSRNLQPLVAQGLLDILPGSDARSRLVVATDSGQLKRAEAQRRWRAAQERLNQILGVERVLALHTLIDEALELLALDETGEDDV
ncbi:MAG: MarR family winged helix-turn-helix transcriptional regulator [Hylemonella sp.]|uniref:MarR family winged helix-turn-helix transcriptional regulator n=1 Tax=Hylemonella sp. TaxID=2066020 RepID=UPI0022C79A09|nr:MarR family winged helix-turn-helix transcriptional regulator [Hylemonella sp.]MCZ8253143.1 MarR family winged helix-turn-helix transcriptional regulator [Hylemonella sp.]